MELRKLGKTGVEIPALGLGCMGMSEFYGPADEDQSIATLHRSIDLRMNHWDTADMYGVGRNEQLLSKVLKERRSEVFLATKFGNVRGPEGQFLGVSGKPDYVRQACDASLSRLGVDQIDLYYQHRVDPEVPIEDTVGAMAELVKQGKVRYLGLSEAAAPTIRKAAAIHQIAALQTEYSLWTRDIEAEILPTIRELGITLVAYSPLGRGFLTGRFTSADQFPAGDFRKVGPRFADENFDKNLALVEVVQGFAKQKGCTPAQLALAWVLARGNDVTAIPGTKKVERLEENGRAMDVQLAAEEVDRIAEAMPPVHGARYPENSLKSVNR
ncbi:MAG: aldo/keto reductase [Candidatus Eisenbacteria bacterium]|uniref:Aldo/keto reductase n=1 Tax=Eiseniibacteriota bacterium TaxID=2212470 RepID=A0A956RQE3_UNCEI|nr:aldo/keto reductase [Candidatus Eisenbacteria bacterium]